MYYSLTTSLTLNQGYVENVSNKSQTLLTGKAIDESKLELPWRLELHYDDDDDDDDEEELIMSDLYSNVMSKSLCQTLLDQGVDSIQFFPAVILNMNTGELITDYVVFNILNKAEMVSPDPLTISRRSVEGKLAVGLVGYLVVIDKVAEVLRKGNYQDLELEVVMIA